MLFGNKINKNNFVRIHVDDLRNIEIRRKTSWPSKLAKN